MEYQFTVYMIPSLFSAGVTVFLALVTLLRRRVPGTYPFAVMMFLAALWSVSYALLLAATSGDSKLFWFNMAQTGPAFTPVLWIILALQYTGYQDRSKRLTGPLFIFPCLTYVLMWTNSLHHWVRTGVEIKETRHFSFLTVEHGFWFYLEILYSYTLLFVSIYLIFRSLRMAGLKKQLLALLISLLVPLVSSLLDVMGVNPLKPYGPTSITFSVSGLIIFYALFKYRLFDIIPIARDKVFDNMAEAVLVVDAKGRIVDANIAAEDLLGGSLKKFTGRRLTEELSGLHALFDGHNAEDLYQKGPLEVEMEWKGKTSFLEAELTKLKSEHGTPPGNVVILKDITERKRQERKLKKAYEEKDALLRELQHRVKNSMSSILSFVRLEIDRNEDPGTASVLEGLKNRIFAFSKLYDLLNRSTDGSFVQLSEYIPLLVDTLKMSFQETVRDVKVDVEVEEEKLNPSNAAAVGLIVNELLTNSFKYAYKQKTDETPSANPLTIVSVWIYRRDDRIVLETLDNGPGLPRDFKTEESTGAGLSIVRLLAGQLGGDLAYIPGNGVHVKIDFPAELHP